MIASIGDTHHKGSLDATLCNEIPLIMTVSKRQKIKIRLKMGLIFTPKKKGRLYQIVND